MNKEIQGNIFCPKVFISYSWTTPEHEKWVINLGERLMKDGINVILDKWDLKEGQDTNFFMESMKLADKVLVICEEGYKRKANTRKGGVGTESQIITADVYENVAQSKYIPIVAERNESGNHFIPSFMESRLYIDLSSPATFDNDYDKLIRNIYEAPLHRKPELGRVPIHLSQNKVSSQIPVELQEKRFIEVEGYSSANSNSYKDEVNVIQGKALNKVFISHSTKDSVYVFPIIELLEGIGIASEQIFCTSYEPYGIPLGENFLERIKAELNENVLVLFIFSSHFFNSPVSLCEMGATWVRSSTHIPILIPPFDFSKVKGVLPQTQGFKINVPEKLNTFKKQVQTLFNLKELDSTIWERKRKRFLDVVDDIIGNSTEISAEVEPGIEKNETKLSYSTSDMKIIKDISSVFTCDIVYEFLNNLQERHSYSHAQLIKLEQTIKRYNAPDKKLRLPELQRAKVEFFESITKFSTYSERTFFKVDDDELDMKFFGGDIGTRVMRTNYETYEKHSDALSIVLNDVNSKWGQFFEITQLTFTEFEWF
jgi:hypothetical protein